MTAIFQETGTWQVMVFGFVTAFIISQMWGAPVVVKYLSVTATGSEERARHRYWSVPAVSVVAYLAIVLVTYYMMDMLSKFLVIFAVTGQLWLVMIMYFGAYMLAYLGDYIMVKTFDLVG